MESVLGRYRNLIILVGVLFLQVLGLAVQVKGSNAKGEHPPLIRVWAITAISPFERGLVWIQQGTGNLWHNYVYLRGVRAENRALRDQIEQMRIEQVRLSEDASQARRLQALLAFKEQYVSKTIAAQVIGSSGSDLSKILLIDKGEADGMQGDLAVITADGIVGKVLQVFSRESQVLLISDQTSGVGAILEKSRLQGVLRGTANGEVMLERIMSDEQVLPGERVLTSGGDHVFPKGLPVGVVASVSPGKDLFLNVKIKPAANLSKLEEVLVITEKDSRQSTAEDTVRMRAADILAERLPSVPEKPPVPATGAPAAGAGTVQPGKPQAGGPAQNKVQSPASKPAANAPASAGPAPGGNHPAATTAASPAASSGTKTSAKPGATQPNGSAASRANGAVKPASEAPVPDQPKTSPPNQPPAGEDSPH